MKPSRNWMIWAALTVCAVMVVSAMVILTRNVRASQHERAAAEARADLEEQTRLALWRMDGAGAAILLRENQRPPADYAAMPLANDPQVKLHFEVRDGQLVSPEAMEAGNSASPPPEAARHAELMKPLRRLLAKNGDLEELLKQAAIPGETAGQLTPPPKAAPPGPPGGSQKDTQSAAQDASPPNAQELTTNNPVILNSSKRNSRARYTQVDQDEFNRNEMQQRAKVVQSQVPQNQLSYNVSPQQALGGSNAQPLPGANPEGIIDGIKEISNMRPLWIENELFLMRQLVVWNPQAAAHAAGKGPAAAAPTIRIVQGVWLDAAAIRQSLLTEVADLLPSASLSALANPGATSAADPLALVSFPFRLHRNESVSLTAPPWNGPLLVGWTAVLCALAAVAALVRGVMRLSERRASFVSAVTHELRTPLTTFRLYSDMLESGAVKEEKRGSYLRVLSREADRLSHLVENVLAFSRIERGNARSNVRATATGELLESMRERLAARLATAGLSLEMTTGCPQRVRVDTAAVEHILFNLIDNAAKYAANSNPPVVTIGVQGKGRTVEITVSDHGPGIPPAEHGRIFRAFHKSAREAAESQPGVGLGLALSRRLAKAQGGQLECAAMNGGACFILRLPAE